MSVKETLEQKLAARFPDAEIDVRDDSHLHAGHAGARPEGETHFHVKVHSSAFEGLSRVARQRLILECLSDELAGPVHALSIDAAP